MRVTKEGVFFWSGTFSQWHKSKFRIDGVNFVTAEQYMMYKKAKLFGDDAVANEIMKTANPRTQKELGRKVRGFDKDKWESVCREYVYQGNYAKFTQNPEFLKELLNYGDRKFIEASPKDKIWGIGLHFSDDRILDPKNWQGTNWLGEAITRVRDEVVNLKTV